MRVQANVGWVPILVRHNSFFLVSIVMIRMQIKFFGIGLKIG
jgi:hypothetical protein